MMKTHKLKTSNGNHGVSECGKYVAASIRSFSVNALGVVAETGSGSGAALGLC